jgi:hypothetical protein
MHPSLPNRPTPLRQVTPGSYRWRLARGLLSLSDLAREYEAIRSPRGCYRVSLPEDICE